MWSATQGKSDLWKQREVINPKREKRMAEGKCLRDSKCSRAASSVGTARWGTAPESSGAFGAGFSELSTAALQVLGEPPPPVGSQPTSGQHCWPRVLPFGSLSMGYVCLLFFWPCLCFPSRLLGSTCAPLKKSKPVAAQNCPQRFRFKTGGC